MKAVHLSILLFFTDWLISKMSFLNLALQNVTFSFLANEFRAWLLYYSLPSLKDILPVIYWKHFALLVEPLHILLGDTITKEDLDWSKKCLDLFYKFFTAFYGKRNSLCITIT